MEMADGGSIFLDEIGLLSPEFQAKLLNVLETQCFRRVGGTAEMTVSVRFLAATNEDLEEVGTGRQVSRGLVLSPECGFHRLTAAESEGRRRSPDRRARPGGIHDSARNSGEISF